MYGMKLFACGLCLILLALVLAAIGWFCFRRSKAEEADTRIKTFGRTCVELAMQRTGKTPSHGTTKPHRKEAVS